MYGDASSEGSKLGNDMLLIRAQIYVMRCF